MIPFKDLEKIKIYLEESQNPLFLFDDDNDGLCSYILLRQFIGRGNGVAIKSTPELDKGFLNRVDEFMPDIVFILDKPIVSQDFIDGVRVPVIWIDHHPVVKRSKVKYFNPKLNNPEDTSSTTCWCYKAVGGKLWIATLGAVSDWMIPDYFDEFKEKYAELVGDKKTPPEILYDTKFGELCRVFSFLIKGKTSAVNKNIKTLLKIDDPYEVLEQTSEEGRYLSEQAEKINKEYQKILDNALKVKAEDGLIVFSYTSRNLSLTADLSNELLYRNPDKIIIVARQKDDDMRMSIRSSEIKVKLILEKVLKKVEGYGGGHDFAVGANVKVHDFDKFVKEFKEEISKG